ncbi:MAG: hypothetical protein SPD93_05360 [Lachnospiraceae bacterium]|nr:hypothetical protein [Lachnospiraceae bacterium]
MDINVSDLSGALRFDSSYLSRIRSGQRKPANLEKFILETAGYIARTNSPSAIAGLIGQPAEELVPGGVPLNCAVGSVPKRSVSVIILGSFFIN